MSTEDPITVWLNRLAEHDEVAAEEIWRVYFEKVVRYTRRKMANLPKRAADEEDVALSAMNSFIGVVQRGQYDALRDRDDLWKMLVTIAARKLSAARRKHFAAKRGGGQVCGESALGATPTDDAQGLQQILSNEPSPELAAEVADQCHALLSGLHDDILRRIVELKLQGFDNEEIARQLDCNVRTVQRKLDIIRTQMLRNHSDDQQ